MAGTPWEMGDLRATQARGWMESARSTVDSFLAEAVAPVVRQAVENAMPRPGIQPFELPTFESLALWRTAEEPTPAPQPPSSAAPAAMPTAAPRTVEATIQDGRVTPPSAGGQWDALPVRSTERQPASAGGGDIDNSSRESFVRTAWPYMLQAANGDQNLAELMLAKAISENGSIGTGRPFWANNFSGIKGTGDAGSVEADTWEDYGNGPVNIRDRFAAYSTPQSGMAAFMDFLRNNPRYHGALARYQETGNADALFDDILAAGYATDKQWANKVRSIRDSQVAPVVRRQVADPRQSSLNAGGGSGPQPSAPPAGPAAPPSGAGLPETAMWSPDAPAGPQGAYQAAVGRSGGGGVMLRQPLDELPADGGMGSEDWDAAQRPSAPTDWSQPVQPPAGGFQSNSASAPNPAADSEGVAPTESLNAPEMQPQSANLSNSRQVPPAAVDPGQWLAEDSVSTAPGQVAAYPGEPDYAAPAPARPMQPPPSPYAAGQAESMEPRADRFEPRPSTYGQVQTAGYGEPDYVDSAPRTVTEQAGRFIRDQRGPGGILEPLGGGARITARMAEIRRQAAAELGMPGLNDFRAVSDPGWQARNPELVDEYAQLQTQLDLSMLGNMDAPRRVAQGAMQAAVPVVREAAEGAASRVSGLVDDAAPPRLPQGETSLGSGLAPTRSDLRNAAQGGVIGAASEGVTDEELTPEQRLARIGMGAALGVGAGRAARPGAGRRLGSGVVPEPDDLTRSMRSHVVPPDVADTLDFPVRIPDDPRAVSAIQRIGGTIDPERGVTFHVTRAQGAGAAGEVATRGGVFYEAVEPGGRSNFVRSADDPNVVGGSQVIPATPTRFRSPLIVSDAPGSNRGFDEAMRAMNTPTSSIALDREVVRARAAGPDGSQQRADALREVVRSYGGDPDLIDPLIAVRGADAAESQWAIRENILAAHARRNGYDGVVTVQDDMSPNDYSKMLEDAVQAHPRWQAQKAVVDAANAKIDEAARAYRETGAASPNADELFEIAEREQRVLERIHDRLIDEVQVTPPTKITELADVREARNPTPGEPDPNIPMLERAEQEAHALFQEVRDNAMEGRATNADVVAAMQAHDDAVAALRAAQKRFVGEPGYTLREDIPRRPQPPEQPPMQLNSAGSGAALGAAGGGLTGEEDGEFDPERALMGAVIGAVVGRRPRGQAAAAASDPIMQRMARQMAGQHMPSGVVNRRSWAERWAQAWTDDRAGLRTFQQAVSARLGRPLTSAENVAELTRVNPNSVAFQRLNEEVGPALQRVGDDEDYLAQYLTHRHNVDVAREMGQRAYDEAIAAGRPPQQASRAAMQAANARQFSGDLRLNDTLAQLQAIEQRVLSLPDGAARWKNVQDAAQAVWEFSRRTLERKRDAGMLDDALLQELQQRYPHYVRTDIADYFDKGPQGPGPAGRRVGVSDIGIQKIGAEGTTKERVNPLLSLIDQAYTAEAAIVRNQAGRAFEDLLRLDPTWQTTFREVAPAQGVNRGDPTTTVPASYTLKNGEQKLTVWDNGKPREFIVPPEYAALVSPQAGRIFGDSGAANAWQWFMNAYKALITSKNPGFAYLVSPVRDLGDYAIREATQSASASGAAGAAQAVGAVPGILADYVQAIPTAFAGVTSGRFRGDLADLMRSGAGMMGRPRHDQGELRQALRELQRTNGLEVRSLGDLARVAGDVLTLGAGPVGNRLEQVPRIAAARRAARRGADEIRQTMAARDATVDFQRAGEWSRAANALIPFFNVAMQSGAQTARTFKQNPAAATAAVATVVGLPVMLAEAWNNSDPGRAADYGDVPDYLKRTGIVLMLPGVEGVSERGDRLPNYLWIPVGQAGALVQAARQTAQDAVAGKPGADLSSPQGWAEIGAEVAGIFSPIRGDSASSVVSSVLPPGLGTAAELAANRDLFRGSTIATDRRDESASALSQGSARAFSAVTGAESRPSQWEYAYRDLGGIGATLATTASNMVAEATGARQPKDESRPLQSPPIVGGLTGRIVRDAGGQRLEDATEDAVRVPSGVRDALAEAGMRREQITRVPSSYRGASLTRDEQERWQEATNSLIERKVAQARRSSEWRARGADRQRIIQEAVTEARNEAAERALRRLNEAEIERRKQREERRKAG